MDLTGVLIALGLGGIFAIIGIIMLVIGQRERTKARATEQWPTVEGTVTSSQIEAETRTSRDDDGMTRHHTTHIPLVAYTYVLQGKTYQGNKVFPGGRMGFDVGTAQGIINRYQVGQAATVHYNPADPAEAVLETKAKGGNILIIIGAVFAVVGLIACCAGGAFALLG
jgi:hypothetical protein